MSFTGIFIDVAVQTLSDIAQLGLILATTPMHIMLSVILHRTAGKRTALS